MSERDEGSLGYVGRLRLGFGPAVTSIFTLSG